MTPPRHIQSLQPLRLLYVEDDSVDVLTLQRTLAELDLDVNLAVAPHGKAALQVLRHNAYDLILLNLKMPVMNGREFLRHYRHRGYKIPIVVLSASRLESDKQLASEYGAIRYLQKAATSDDTRKDIRTLFEDLVRRRVIPPVLTRSAARHPESLVTFIPASARLSGSTAVALATRVSASAPFVTTSFKDFLETRGSGSDQRFEPVAVLAKTFDHESTTLRHVLSKLRSRRQNRSDGCRPLLAFAKELNTAVASTRHLIKQVCTAGWGRPEVWSPLKPIWLLMHAVGSVFESYPDRIDLGELYMGAAVVLGHAELLRHLYATLIRHALEATAAKEDGRVTVSAKRCAAVFEVLVHDPGPEITGAEQERLFQPRVTTKRRGLGVGLYLARTAARLHGGEVTCESHAGSGATWRVSIPLIEDDAAEPG